MKERKEKKAEAKKSTKTDYLNAAYKPTGAQVPPAKEARPATTGTAQPNNPNNPNNPLKRANSIQVPRLSVIERKRMRINFEMALQTKKQEAEKPEET